MKIGYFFLVKIVLISLLCAACKPVQLSTTSAALPETTSPTAIPRPEPSETASPTDLPETEPSETITLRIRLATTSDWTDLFLVSGATWLSHDLVSANEGATTADAQLNQLILDQPLSRSQAGESSELIVDVQFSILEGEEAVLFKVQRGDLGFTNVEFSRNVGDEWVVIKTIHWEGIAGDGLNAHNFEITIGELSGVVSLPGASQPQPGGIVVSPVIGIPQGTDGYPWWNDTVFYEIFVRSFYDSNGDGIGDLNGIIEKLDYLNDGNADTSTDLGITGIWLMPIYPSPSYHGYDVTDFYGVNPEYGTLDDLKSLLDAAHARGIRVILDITLNHTSSQHPWFIESCDPASPYHDWYIWSDVDPDYTGYWGQQVWFPYQDKYYYSTFSANFADLNYHNPDVLAEMQNVVRFWLEDVGVDGFRLDAAKHMIEEGNNQANTPSTHAWWKSFRTFYKQINPQAVTVGEIWDTTAINSEYLQGDEFDLAFDFYLAGLFIQSLNEGNSMIANQQLELSYSSVPALQFATFLTNHDQDRVIDQLGNDPQKGMAAASFLLTAPGVPFLYYGEEIGMTGQKPDEQIRSPMQWSADPFADFSTVSPWEPLGSSWPDLNVESETNNPASLLSHYRNLIQIRNQHAALRVGDLSIVNASNSALYSILRVSQQEAVLVLINLTGNTVTDYTLSMEQSSLAEGSYTLTSILGEGEFAPVSVDSIGGFSQYVPGVEVPPYGTFILQLNAP
jgi:alpha-amylase